MWLDVLDFANPELNLCIIHHQLDDDVPPRTLTYCNPIAASVPVARMRTASFVLEIVYRDLRKQFERECETFKCAPDAAWDMGDLYQIELHEDPFYKLLLGGRWRSTCSGCGMARVADSGIRETMLRMLAAKKWLDVQVRLREDAEEEMAEDEEMVVVKQWTDDWADVERGEV